MSFATWVGANGALRSHMLYVCRRAQGEGGVRRPKPVLLVRKQGHVGARQWRAAGTRSKIILSSTREKTKSSFGTMVIRGIERKGRWQGPVECGARDGMSGCGWCIGRGEDTQGEIYPAQKEVKLYTQRQTDSQLGAHMAVGSI